MVLAGLMPALIPPGYAQSSRLASGYEPNQGEPFFLLSDAVIGSNEEARVRLELTQNAAAEAIGGVDIALYRVQKPIEFLTAQKNLHRIVIPAVVEEEGLANVLIHLWDSWTKQARMSWQGIFRKEARLAVTEDAPGTKRSPQLLDESRFEQAPRFRTPASMNPIARFRYPVTKAASIKPPEGVKLPGSSSEFKLASEGNVYIPLGKLPPGLYLVEAALGSHRALTVVFVSDVISVTKAAAKQLLVWTVNRLDGAPAAGVQLLWTDGVGVLHRGSSDAKGLANFDRANPEQSYVIGQDAKGGVFITENFYYDSEIYNTKLYAVTDRPLYQPGDTVMVKFIGREFTSARASKSVASGEIKLSVLDPNGLPIANLSAPINSQTGGDSSFQLPQNATAGGYELRFAFGGNQYGAAFRVSEYQKPHFEMAVVPEKSEFKTGEAVTGNLQLSYPDGSPVKEAQIDLTGRAQALTMVDGELDYAGQFPLKLATSRLSTDANGNAKFSLPAAAVPSRYILSALATDGAAYRVRATRELLVERAAAVWSIRAAKQFSDVNEKVRFALKPADPNSPGKPAGWDWVRLEDRATASGALAASASVAADRSIAENTTSASAPSTNLWLELTLDKPGTYTVTARDEKGNVLAATSHWVSGAGVKPAAGNIDMVSDKTRYAPGETASVLISFPEPVEHALFTLERDAIEKTALLSEKSTWISARQITPNQWRAELKMSAEFSPNITLSVAYVKNGEFVFQNQGLAIEQSRIEIAIKPDKTTYAPGETASVELSTSIDGKPASAVLTASVVDEMIYVLQPEIAPGILDFFYHPRRNNVRTTSTQAFITYDLASHERGNQPRRRGAPERAVKLMERPRRENVDTAFWNPTLVTDANGKARFEFRVPESLTRWRITVRAFDAAGTVGQKSAHLRSDKPLYAKWTSPNWLRAGDAPIASVAIFNNTGKPQELALAAQGAGLNLEREFTARPGASFVPLSFGEIKPTAQNLNTQIKLSLSTQGQVVDTLLVPLSSRPIRFMRQASQIIDAAARTTLALPVNASNVSVSLMSNSAAQFGRISEDLIDYPFGCVEQTASRMLPLSLALASARPDQASMLPQLNQRLATARVRLAAMAGANARFGWWGSQMGEDPFMTVYAYYADWLANRALRQSLPAEHWQRLQEVYASSGYKAPLAQRALMLHFMAQMSLPVTSLNLKLAQAAATAPTEARNQATDPDDSLPLGAIDSELASAFSLVLAHHTAGGNLPGIDASSVAAAQTIVRASKLPLARALTVLTGKAAAGEAEQLLAQMASHGATLDRAVALVWLYQRGDRSGIGAPVEGSLEAPWVAHKSLFGQPVFRLPEGTAIPATLATKPGLTPGVSAVLNYETPETTPGSLDVALTRQLYRLKLDTTTPTEPKKDAGSKGNSKNPPTAPEFAVRSSQFKLIPVADTEALSSSELYLEQIELKSSGIRSLQQGLVQIGLPPGASMEPSTWGVSVQFPGSAEPTPMNRAVGEATSTGYVVPVQLLRDAPLRFTHLLRFSQKGSYAVPRARFHLMYQPGAVAHELAADKSLERKLVVN